LGEIKIKQNNHADLIVEIQQQEFIVYFFGDIHLDNPSCDDKLFLKHLRQAKEENAYCVIIGDLVDGMQLHFDPRHRKSTLRPSFLVSDYLNELTRYVVDLLEPYKDSILLIGYGNHETYIQKKTEYDIVKEISRRLGTYVGGYEGFIVFQLRTTKRCGSRFRRVVYYNHGGGGMAPMTMGVLDHKRSDIWLRDVDLIVTGHRHQTFVYEQPTLGINKDGERISKTIFHIQVPAYLQRGDKTGYSAVKLLSPVSKGCYRVRFYQYSKFEPKIEITRI
jgi:UDP-2,3-diacylglucosamine pyrophosphatase LpxH